MKAILEDVVATQGLESFFGPNSPVLQSILLQAYTVVNNPALNLQLTSAVVSSQFQMALYQPILYCGQYLFQSQSTSTTNIANLGVVQMIADP